MSGRDNLHLRPAGLTRAAAARLNTGLRALEAYLRRLILLMALVLEPDLEPVHYPPRRPRDRSCQHQRAPRGLAIFTGERNFPRGADALSRSLSRKSQPDLPRGAKMSSARYLARIDRLKALIEAPQKRARRLAFYIARRRHGLLAPPGMGRTGVPRRYGTEVSALYDGMSAAILRRSRARPPPLAPVPRLGPVMTCFD